MGNKEFRAAITKAAKQFKKNLPKKAHILSDDDADGITSAAIITTMLERLGVPFSIEFLTRVKGDFSKKIKDLPEDVLLFLDYGGRQYPTFAGDLPDKQIWILDHHPPSKEKYPNVTNLDPFLYNINGSQEIPSAGICYLFAEAVDPKNKDLIHLALAGAIGDFQRKTGEFVKNSLNQELFEQALREGFVESKKGPHLIGWTNQLLPDLLSNSATPFIPKISGSKVKAKEVLKKASLPVNKTYSDLSKSEQRKFLNLFPRKVPFEDKIYRSNAKIKDHRELDMLAADLNGISQQKHPDLSVSVAKEDNRAYQEAKKYVQAYQKQLLDGLKFFYENEANPEIVIKTKRAVYFLAYKQPGLELASAVSSLLSVNLPYEGRPLFLLTKMGNRTKISARIIGTKNPKKIHLGEINEEITKKLGEFGGGHARAAGGNIPRGQEETFIKLVEERLKADG